MTSTLEVVGMDEHTLADLVRYHVLVHVFRGDIAAWQHVLTADPDGTGAREDDVFLDWLQARVAAEPQLLARIRLLVHQVDSLISELPRRGLN